MFMVFLYYFLVITLVIGSLVYFTSCLIALAGLARSVSKDESYEPTVSVIVAARNEEVNIGTLLDDLVRQDYPDDKLEIVVVDDCSSDSTEGFCPYVDTTCTPINTCRTCNTFEENGGVCREIDHLPNATVAEYGVYDRDGSKTNSRYHAARTQV